MLEPFGLKTNFLSRLLPLALPLVWFPFRRRSFASHLVPIALILLLPLTFILMPIHAHSGEVTLAWNPNTEPDLDGYKIYCGTSSGNYDYHVDVGNQTTCTISNLEEGNTYFIAATAYDQFGNESGFSQEVRYIVPESPINNHAPVASDGTLTVTENTTGSGTLSATDTDGDALIYNIVTNGTAGTATITNATTGAYTYAPKSNVTGTDSFTFKANDGRQDSNVATVTVTIMPTLDTDADGIADDEELNIYGTDPNRADTDGDGLDDGQELSLWGNAWNADYDHDGLVNLLDPDADGDGFSDGLEQSRGSDPSNQASYPSGGSFGLQLREHEVYAAYNPAYTFNKPTSSTIRCASSSASLGNGYMFVCLPKDAIDGKRLSLRWATSATYYNMVFVARVMDGAYDRTSSSDFPPGTVIPYKGKGPLQTIEFLTGSHPAHTVDVTLDLSSAQYSTVTIIIQMNDAKDKESAYFDIEHLRILDSTDNILWDLDLSQTVTMEQTGTIGDYGRFGAVDTDSDSDTGGTNNHAPVASDGSLTVTENTTGSGTLSASDTDGDALTYSILTNGTMGTAMIGNATTGAYTYAPKSNVTGADSFTFKANDGRQDSNEATVTVTIMPTLDSDADGIADHDELNIYGTDPNRADTDGDGMDDGDELVFWGNNWNADYDNDGIINILDQDSDGDNLSDGEEVEQRRDPAVPDTIPSNRSANIEIGDVYTNHDWHWVGFSDAFFDPVVVAKPLSCNDKDPAVVRIRGIDENGFEIRVQEWDYLDGIHATETIGYIVIERGRYTLKDGTAVEAGSFETDTTRASAKVTFSQPFQVVPIVIASVISVNGPEAVSTGIRNITTGGFEFRMQEQDSNDQIHAVETISYIAWEPSAGTVDGLIFEIGKVQKRRKDRFYTISYCEPFPNMPVFLADMQTTNGRDTANLRWETKDRYGVRVKVDEEQSRNKGKGHKTEVVGYMVFDSIH